MRISTTQMQQMGAKAMIDQQSKLAKTQLQLSSGLRIQNPSDDPSGSAQLIGLEQSLKITQQYQSNIDSARARLNLEETTLNSVTSIADRVRELAIQGNSSTLTDQDRSFIALEVRQRLDELMSLANTRDANGEYLYSGFMVKTQPFSTDSAGNFVYSGDDGQRFVQTGPSSQVAVGDSGKDVFQAIRNGNGTFATADNAGNLGSGIIDPGTLTDPSAYDGDTYTVTFPLETPATATLMFNDNIGVDDNLTYTLDINGTTVYTVNETGSPVNTLSDLASEINKSETTTGVRAYVTGGKLYLGYTSPSSAPIVVTEALAGASDGDNDTATGYFGSALTGVTATSASIQYDAADAAFYLVQDSAGNIDASGTYTDGGAITFNGVQTEISGTPRTSDAFTISPSVNQDLFSVIQALAGSLETAVINSDDRARLNNSINRVLVDLDRVLDKNNEVRSRVGARLNAVDSQSTFNEDFMLQINQTISTIKDLDYTDAITRFNLQITALQAAQQSYSKIQGLSLFNYL